MSAPRSEATLELAGVSRRFGDVIAVDDVSLEVRRGETVALLGPNGAGKTTVLEMILGLRRPHAGAIRVLGTSTAKATAGGRVGAMLQEGGVPPGARVAELVDLVRRLYPRPLALAEAMRLTGLEPLAERRVERLSGGEKQRVRLALALAGRPELLVLDEPTAALDVAARRSFWIAAGRYVAGGRSLVFATHRLEEAEDVADRVVVMARGRVVADGEPAEVKARAGGSSTVRFAADGVPLELLARLPAVERIETGRGRVSLRTHDPNRTVRALVDAVPALHGLEVTATDLEEAFLTLTTEEDS
jgi:ABC-2 type transport system ATP-binding protein